MAKGKAAASKQKKGAEKEPPQQEKGPKRPSLESVLKSINKEYGAGTIIRASEHAYAGGIPRISTGVFEIDVATGGGVPKGRLTFLVGPESSSKTTICCMIVAQAQHTCRSCMTRFEYHRDAKKQIVVDAACACGQNTPHIASYLDSEGTFDFEWAEAHGVDTLALIYMAPGWSEQGFDTANALLRTGELDLFFIDSVAQSAPGDEVEKSFEDMLVGVSARVNNRGWRTIQASLNSLGMQNPNKPAIIVVNQFRLKIGVMHGDPRTLPGGEGQKYAAGVQIELTPGAKVDSKGKLKGSEPDKIGAQFTFKLVKSKVTGATPFAKGKFTLYFADAPHLGIKKATVNTFEMVLDYGVLLGVIRKTGWYDLQTEFGPEYVNPDAPSGNFQSKDSVRAFLAADPERVKRVSARILEVAKTAVVAPRADDDDDDAGEEE